MEPTPSYLTPEGDLPPVENVTQWAQSAMNEKKWTIAAQRWAVLRSVYPDSPEVWIKAAICHRESGETDTAAELLSKAQSRFPDNADVPIEQIRLSLQTNQLETATRTLERVRREFPDSMEVLLISVQVEQRLGRHDRALNYGLQACERFPDQKEVWVQQAEWAMESGDWESALVCWDEVRRRFPKAPEGYIRAAEAARQVKKERLARQLLQAKDYGPDWLASVIDNGKGEKPKQKIYRSKNRDLWAFVDLVVTKARLNLKAEASQSYLHYFWWIIDPLLYMSVFYIVFGLLMQRGGPGFLAYLLTGLVPFQWFAKTIQQTSNSIVSGKLLMHQVSISPLFFPLVGIVQNTCKQILVFAMLGLFLVFYGLSPTLHWLAFIPVMLVQLLFIGVASCLVSMLVPFVRDISNLIPTGIQFLLFGSGVFFYVDNLSGIWKTLFYANPMASILYQYRLIFVQQQWPDLISLGWVALVSFAGLGIVIYLNHRFGAVYPRVVTE